MGTYIEPFDFKKILIDYFLGNQVLFLGFFVIVMSAVCGYYQMTNRVFIILILISSLLLATYLGEAVVFAILVLAGIIIFKMFARLSNQ